MNTHSKNIAILVVILVIAFLGPFSGNMILPMFRSLRESYGIGAFMLGLSITMFMIPFSIFQLFSGALSDAIYGRKKIIVFGMTLYGLGSFAASISPNIYLFLTFRVLQGIGYGLVLPISMALVGDLFKKSMRGKIMGLTAIATTLGNILGPIFGGFIVSISWRLGFIVVAILSLVFAIHVQLTKWCERLGYRSVSYTHLTLPTN